MEALLKLDASTYDLDGLLRVADDEQTDFIFMIQDEDGETCYIDRMETEKYDGYFTKFVHRTKAYLETDETHGLFVLFARCIDEGFQLYDGNHRGLFKLETEDITFEEHMFYGMYIQHKGPYYTFKEVIYIQGNYEGDARAVEVQGVGALTSLLEAFILAYV